jgi:hypothetical protein
MFTLEIGPGKVHLIRRDSTRVRSSHHTLRRGIMNALRDLLSAFDPELPLARARTIPTQWYRDTALADLERR